MTTRPNCADLGATDQGSQESHMRSHEVTIQFSPITRDRMKIESREWCRKTARQAASQDMHIGLLGA